MFVKEVVVQNQVGLHARPATFFIQKANEFKASIWVEKEDLSLIHIQMCIRDRIWEEYDETHTVVRFCTSWATQDQNVQQLLEDIRAL